MLWNLVISPLLVDNFPELLDVTAAAILRRIFRRQPLVEPPPAVRAAFHCASRLKNPPSPAALPHPFPRCPVPAPLGLSPQKPKIPVSRAPFLHAPKPAKHLTPAACRAFSRDVACRVFKNNPPDPAARCPPPPRAALQKSKLSAPPSRGHKKEPLERFERLLFSTFSIIFCRNRQSF